MNKELTPLEIINIKLKDKNNKYDRRVVNCSDEYLYLIKEEEIKLIEIALKRLENIDKIFKKYDINDNWLEPALYVIKKHFPMDTETQLKKLKVLEIILTKDIDVGAFKKLVFGRIPLTNKEKLDYWNDIHSKKITMGEYSLLKEVLL